MKISTKFILFLVFLLFGKILMVNSVSATDSYLIKSVSVSPDQVTPGENFYIKIEIENNGDKTLEGITLTLNLTNLPFVPNDSLIEKTININEGDKEKVKFELETLFNAESGIYKIPLLINYSGENKLTIVAVTVNSKPEIVLEKEDGLLLKGQKNKLNIKIVNKGLSNINFLEIKGKEAAGYNILSSDYFYIGSIDTDDFDTVEFEIFINKISGSTINFPVELIYKDITNKEYKEILNLNLKVYSLEDAYSLGLLNKNYTTQIVIAVIFLIILWLVYRKIRKAKRLTTKKQ